jgi:hypothetical protein
MDEPGTGEGATTEGATTEGATTEGATTEGATTEGATTGAVGVATDELHPPTTALTSNPIAARVSALGRGRTFILFMSTSI